MEQDLSECLMNESFMYMQEWWWGEEKRIFPTFENTETENKSKDPSVGQITSIPHCWMFKRRERLRDGTDQRRVMLFGQVASTALPQNNRG